jgi:hypothetical protein
VPRRLDSLGSALYLAAAMSFRPRALPAGFVAPCLPTTAPHPPSGEPWLHEIKQDGFRGHRAQEWPSVAIRGPSRQSAMSCHITQNWRGRSLYDSLEQEMASLLGRSGSKT